MSKTLIIIAALESLIGNFFGHISSTDFVLTNKQKHDYGFTALEKLTTLFFIGLRRIDLMGGFVLGVARLFFLNFLPQNIFACFYYLDNDVCGWLAGSVRYGDKSYLITAGDPVL